MKKLFFIILFTSLTIFSFGQQRPSKVDSILFSLVNSFRDSLGIQKLTWDTNLYKAAQYHSEYLIKCPLVLHQDKIDTNIFETDSVDSHSETVNIKDFKNLKKVRDRFNKFMSNLKGLYCTENIAEGTFAFTYKKQTDLEIANHIFNMWLNSLPHKKNMLDPRLRFSACCTKSEYIYLVDEYLNGAEKKIRVLYTYSTIDFYTPQ